MTSPHIVPGSPTDAVKYLKQAGCSPRVIAHCRSVAATAKRIAEDIAVTNPVDTELVYIGALVHDIGRAQNHSIHHAVVGAEMGRRLGFSKPVVNIIERHIGAGITRQEAIRLGLPPKDYCPRSLEEKIVAHADNLTKGTRPQSLQECLDRLKQQSVDQRVIQRVIRLHEELSNLCSRPL